jgi:nucleotide-binding universal stress UspA family protein
MIPYGRLLLATEHTEFDVGAEHVALDLARQRGVPLAGVIPIVSNVEYESVAPERVARMEGDVHARFVALRGDAARAGVDLDLRVRRGEEPWRGVGAGGGGAGGGAGVVLYLGVRGGEEPWREIVAEAKERAADLLVIRRRGKRSFLANLMVGEMVGRVATAAPCSVLMVPRAARLWSRCVLAGIDGTGAGQEVARTAARMAVAAGLPLTVVSVAAHDKSDERAAAEHVIASAVAVARGEGADVAGQVAVGGPADAIAELATPTGADLLVVGRGGPDAHGRFHFGSNAQRVVGLASCAVLVVRT